MKKGENVRSLRDRKNKGVVFLWMYDALRGLLGILILLFWDTVKVPTSQTFARAQIVQEFSGEEVVNRMLTNDINSVLN